MREQRLDVRVQRTINTLEKSLLKLGTEKAYDSITVAELCEAAGIRRATFYKHFKDKNDFLLFTYRKRLDQVNAKWSVACQQENPHAYYTALIDAIVSYVMEYKDVLRGMLQGKNSYPTVQSISTLTTDYIVKHLTIREEAGHEFKNDKHLIAAASVGMLLGTITWWLKSNSDLTHAELTAICANLIFRK